MEPKSNDEDSDYPGFNFVRNVETVVEETTNMPAELDYNEYEQSNIYESGSNTSYTYESNYTDYYSNHYATNGNYSDGSSDSKSSDSSISGDSASNDYGPYNHVVDVRSINYDNSDEIFDDTDLDSDSDYADYLAGLSRKRRYTVEISDECLAKYNEGDESCLCDDLDGKFRLTFRHSIF